jgi:hypothetical protein
MLPPARAGRRSGGAKTTQPPSTCADRKLPALVGREEMLCAVSQPSASAQPGREPVFKLAKPLVAAAALALVAACSTSQPAPPPAAPEAPPPMAAPPAPPPPPQPVVVPPGPPPHAAAVGVSRRVVHFVRKGVRYERITTCRIVRHKRICRSVTHRIGAVHHVTRHRVRHAAPAEAAPAPAPAPAPAAAPAPAPAPPPSGQIQGPRPSGH